ncbi:MAG: hypothetical protein ACYDC1_13475 [Limisphaerales bacterium]
MTGLLLPGLGRVRAGIPEPDLVWYGRVLTISGGTPVRLTTGTLVWHLEPVAGGTAMVFTTVLTNLNDQFSFALRIPCESLEPGGIPSAGVVTLRSPPVGYRRATVTLDGQPLSLLGASGEFAAAPATRGTSERIDLQLSSGPVDADGDGMADDWELLHFGPGGANPGDDLDGDGMSNLREYRAGTNPSDERSRFEVVEVTAGPSGLTVRWSSEAGRSYRIRRSPTLLATPSGYGVLQSGIVATPPLNQLLDTTAGDGDQFFYLIELEE